MHARDGGHKGQQVSELPLILFTMLTPMSVGVSAFALLCGSGLAFALVAGLLAAAGMAASVAHLARPLRAPYSILHWKTSWLSREILAVSAYFGIVVLWCLAAFLAPSMGMPLAVFVRVLNALAFSCGLALLFVIARAYRVAPIPAWDGSENVLELGAVALGPGVALAMAAGSCLAVLNADIPSAALVLLEGGAAVLILLDVSSIPAVPIAIASLVASLILNQLAFRRRTMRLEAADDTRAVELARARCRLSRPKVRLYCTLALVGAVVAASSMLAVNSNLLYAILWTASAVIEIVSHCIGRTTFYTLPSQERIVPRLR